MVIPCWYLPRLLKQSRIAEQPAMFAGYLRTSRRARRCGLASGADGRSDLVKEPALDPFEGAVDVHVRQRAIGGPQHQAHGERLLAVPDLWTAVEVDERDRLHQSLAGGPDRLLHGRVGRGFVEDERD